MKASADAGLCDIGRTESRAPRGFFLRANKMPGCAHSRVGIALEHDVAAHAATSCNAHDIVQNAMQ